MNLRERLALRDGVYIDRRVYLIIKKRRTVYEI